MKNTVISRCTSCFRGRVIPADLEAKIIDAKQKVGVFFSIFLLLVFVSLSIFLFN